MKKSFLYEFYGVSLSKSNHTMPDGQQIELGKVYSNPFARAFGKIKEDGGKVRAVFIFKNTGTTKLLIINAEPSCGCTVGEWTKDSIAPLYILGAQAT